MLLEACLHFVHDDSDLFLLHACYFCFVLATITFYLYLFLFIIDFIVKPLVQVSLKLLRSNGFCEFVHGISSHVEACGHLHCDS